jgi:hypothetical protein
LFLSELLRCAAPDVVVQQLHQLQQKYRQKLKLGLLKERRVRRKCHNRLARLLQLKTQHLRHNNFLKLLR